jgi:hypothetical protein
MVAICSAVAALVLGFSIGFLVGRLLMAMAVKRELESPDSEMSRMIIRNIEMAGAAVTESAAKAADAYQDGTRCINGCGSWIAKLIREAQPLRNPNP